MAPASVVPPLTNDEETHDGTAEAGSGGEQALEGEQVAPAKQRTPLPVRQLFVLCLIRFAEPISFSVVSRGFTIWYHPC